MRAVASLTSRERAKQGRRARSARANALELAVERELARLQALVGADDVHDGVDQRQVREGLREVAEVAPGLGVDLLGVEHQRARVAEQLLAQPARAPQLADLAERADQ